MLKTILLFYLCSHKLHFQLGNFRNNYVNFVVILVITFNCKTVFASLSKHFQCFKINPGVMYQKIGATVSFMITQVAISTDIHVNIHVNANDFPVAWFSFTQVAFLTGKLPNYCKYTCFLIGFACLTSHYVLIRINAKTGSCYFICVHISCIFNSGTSETITLIVLWFFKSALTAKLFLHLYQIIIQASNRIIYSLVMKYRFKNK